MASLIINNTIIKGLENVAESFNNIFLAVSQNLNLHHAGKEGTMLFLKESFPGNFPGLQIISVTQTEMKSIRYKSILLQRGDQS
jgi:hypothetical protein